MESRHTFWHSRIITKDFLCYQIVTVIEVRLIQEEVVITIFEDNRLGIYLLFNDTKRLLLVDQNKRQEANIFQVDVIRLGESCE